MSLAAHAASFPDFGAKSDQIWPVSWFGAPEEERPARQEEALRLPPRPHERRLRLNPGLWRKILPAADWLILAAAAEGACLWSTGVSIVQQPLALSLPLLAAILAVKAGLWLCGAYTTPLAEMGPAQGQGALALGVVGALLLSSVTSADPRLAAAIAAILPITGVFLALVHAAMGVLSRAAWRRRAFADRVVLVGKTSEAERLMQRIRKERTLDVAGIFDDAADLSALASWPDLPHMDRIILCIPPGQESRLEAALTALAAAPNRIDLLIDQAVMAAHGRHVQTRAGVGLVNLARGPQPRPFGALRRAADIVIAAALLLLFAPVIAILAAQRRLAGAPRALARRAIWGRNNAIVEITTLTPDHGRTAPSALEKLPWLVHVVLGDLRLIGPRPRFVAEESGAEPADAPLVRRVPPGLLSPAALAKPANAAPSAAEELRHELAYIERASPWLDLVIALRAVTNSFARAHRRPR